MIPLKATLATVPSNHSDVRSAKRVRFAAQMEDSPEGHRSMSAASPSRLHPRVIDPWRQDGPLHDSYVEYLKHRDALATSSIEIRPRPMSTSPAEGERNSFTHTFLTQSNSSPKYYWPSPPRYSSKTGKRQLPRLDSYFKQKLMSPSPPRMIPRGHMTNVSHQQNPSASLNAALRRTRLAFLTTADSHPQGKTGYLPYAHPLHDRIPINPTRASMARLLSGAPAHIDSLSKRPMRSAYSKSPNGHIRAHLRQAVLHSSH